uniref:Uncharacterized protein n=1 Tax=Zea mays TaxID=4577 RepID=A0A804M7A4_MAIZE
MLLLSSNIRRRWLTCPCRLARPCRHELRNLDPFLLLDEFTGTTTLSTPRFPAFSDHPNFPARPSMAVCCLRPHLSLDWCRSLQARRVSRPPPQRIRDRHLHARGSLRLLNSMLRSSSLLFNARELFAQTSPSLWFRLLAAAGGIHPPGLRWAQGHHQDRGRAVDDGGARHRALGDAGGGRRAQGPAALDQPLLQGQDDRAAVPGAGEQGHQPRGERGRRRGGPRHCRGGPRRGVPRVHAHPHHVRGLHHASRVSPAPARPGGLERLRLRRRRRGRVRAGDGHGALLPRPRPRRRRQRVEQVHQAAEVRPRRRAAARRARGAARALRHELARPDSEGHGGLLLWQERLREGRTVELLRLIGEAGSRWRQINLPCKLNILY